MRRGRKNDGRRVFIACAGLLAAPVVAWLGISAHAQGAGQDWEKAAGGKQEFEVASVRRDTTDGGSYSNFSLDGGNLYFTVDKTYKQNPEGSLFSAKNLPLLRYIVFAYKLAGTQELALRFDFYAGLGLHVPDWVRNDRYDIEARAAEPATKDQMRLMMQSLLADRFKLAAHWEARQAPVFALVLEKPGVLGPQLRPHAASDDCGKAVAPDRASKTATAAAQQLGALPIPCGMIAHLPASAVGAHRFGGRDVPLAMLAESMPAQTGLVTLPRPVIDRTGLDGGYDFWMEWTLEDTSEMNAAAITGGTFREALKNQLGLKLEAQKGPVKVLVIDHVEQPGEN